MVSDGVRWCNGSTEVFGAFSLGSNPSRTATVVSQGMGSSLEPPPRAAVATTNLIGPDHMTKDEIASALRDLLRQQKQIKVDVNAVQPETRFDQLGFDSLSILDFLYEVENRFAVVPEMADLVRMQKVGDLIDYLQPRAQS